MNAKPQSLHYSIGEAYFTDARDFAGRFDELWEALPHKSGRIKSFVDLLFCLECILKSRTFLFNQDQEPVPLYRAMRQCNHQLASLGGFAKVDEGLKNLIEEVREFPVGLRYTLDADDAFFNIFIWEREMSDRHAQTIGNHQWVMNVRSKLEIEIDKLRPHFQGEVVGGIEDIFLLDEQLLGFMAAVRQR